MEVYFCCNCVAGVSRQMPSSLNGVMLEQMNAVDWFNEPIEHWRNAALRDVCVEKCTVGRSFKISIKSTSSGFPHAVAEKCVPELGGEWLAVYRGEPGDPAQRAEVFTRRNVAGNYDFVPYDQGNNQRVLSQRFGPGEAWSVPHRGGRTLRAEFISLSE